MPPQPQTTGLLTQVLIADKYGPRLGTDQLAAVLGITRGAVLNQISDGRFGIPTYVDGGKRWADYRDVAAYIDNCRAQALQQRGH
ncbi:hypothetical protein [Alicycliphilus denitrificans]|uniref:hypothetical protein n=1 Tax=Alicycliphilus denitrificans TaxID=179636 RepID=UPI0001DA0E01|nr:hypothetical protein [Alicycliphilus denitrificans]ADV01309.1 hypothetical protein Alide_3592 [Alicycliphilus denitrificans BC]